MTRRAMSGAVLLVLGALLLARISTVGAEAQTGGDVSRSLVVNLESPHPIRGVVTVNMPIPHSAMARVENLVVGPASRDETNLWVDAGRLETDGFTDVVLSVHGTLKGNPSVPGALGVVLIPEEEAILRAFAEGEVHLPLQTEAGLAGGAFYFSGSSPSLPIGFPSYRLYLYNTTDRSASADVFAYLTH